MSWLIEAFLDEAKEEDKKDPFYNHPTGWKLKNKEDFKEKKETEQGNKEVWNDRAKYRYTAHSKDTSYLRDHQDPKRVERQADMSNASLVTNKHATKRGENYKTTDNLYANDAVYRYNRKGRKKGNRPNLLSLTKESVDTLVEILQ